MYYEQPADSLIVSIIEYYILLFYFIPALFIYAVATHNRDETIKKCE